jgi:hypothetical protein
MNKGIIIIILLFSITCFGQKDKTMLDYMNETSATFMNCSNSNNKIDCLETEIGKLIVLKINEQHEKNSFDLKKIQIKILLRVEESGEATILELETENKKIKTIAEKTFQDLPLFVPAYSTSEFRSVTASYGFYTTIELNKKTDNYELKTFKKKMGFEKMPYPNVNDLEHVKYPDCESSNDYKDCLTQKVSELIIQNLNESFIESNYGSRATAYLTFNKKGKLAEINVKSANLELKEKLELIIKNIPDVKPAKLNGKEIQSNYSIPIMI